MAKPDKTALKPKARLPKGMRDIGPAELRQTHAMLETIRAVYER
jgi:histidyl-tRNA synthetase